MTEKQESKELVTVENYALMQIGENISEVIAENLGGDEINPISDLEVIKVPSGGGTMWEIPTIDGEVESKELTGIVISAQTQRLYWAESFEDSGGGAPPDCFSVDGKHGAGDPGGLCNTCPKNQWESSAKGKGKACQERRMLFLLTPDSILPVIVSIPPTSTQAVRKYLVRLAGKGLKPYHVYTKLTLSKDKNADNISFSKANLTFAGKVENPQAIEEYVKGIKPYIDQTAQNMAQDGSAAE